MYAAVDGFSLPYDARYASHNLYAGTYITGLVLATVDGDIIKKMEWTEPNLLFLQMLVLPVLLL